MNPIFKLLGSKDHRRNISSRNADAQMDELTYFEGQKSKQKQNKRKGLGVAYYEDKIKNNLRWWVYRVLMK